MAYIHQHHGLSRSRSSDREAYMLQIRDGHIQDILHLLSYAEVCHYLLSLLAERLVNLESRSGVDLCHLKVMFYRQEIGESGDLS